MAEIPPDLPSSAAQSGVQAREVAKEREAQRVGQAETAKRQINAADEVGSTVETTDDDVAVFTDAEGTGSQGRESQEPAQDEELPTRQTEDKGIVRGEDGHLHLDLEA